MEQGEILIGGVNIKNIATTQLMDTVSFVFQDTFFLQLGDTGFMCLKEFLVYQCAVRFNQRFQFFHKVCI